MSSVGNSQCNSGVRKEKTTQVYKWIT